MQENSEREDIHCINNLPDTALLNIFSFLSFQERKENRLICKRWKLLCSLPRFMKNNQLVLKNCFISSTFPPWSILKDSNIQFKHLVVDYGNLELNQFNSFCIECIGKGVETLTILTEERLLLTNEGLPDLKVLRIPSFHKLMYYDRSNFPEKIEVLEVNCLSPYEQLLHDSPYELIETLQEFENLKTFMVKSTDFDAENHRKTGFTYEIELCEVFSYFYVDKVKFINKNLLGVQSIGYNDIRAFYPRYVELSDVLEFKRFTNLEKLSIRANEELGCFFMHTPMPLHKVTTVCLAYRSRCPYLEKLYAEKFCQTCLTNLITSCPNIDSWNLSGCVPNLTQFLLSTPKPLKKLKLQLSRVSVMLVLNFPELETLDLDSSNFEILCNASYPLPKLKKLVINQGIIYDIEDLTHNAPNLKKIHLNALRSLEDFKAVERNLPYLKEFTFFHVPDDDEQAVIYNVGNNFKELEVLGTCLKPVQRRTDLAMETFKKIPTLRLSFGMPYSRYCMLVKFLN